MKRYVLSAVLVVLAYTVPMGARQGSAPAEEVGTAWSKFGQSMEKMHAGMRSIKPSGNNDADFMKLMLPHHQAAIDMAKTELLYGNDPQARRLAQKSSPTNNRKLS